MHRLPILRLLILVLIFIVDVQKTFAQQGEAEINQMLELTWQPNGTYKVNGGIASLTTTSGEELLLGNDAHKFMFLTEGHNRFKPDAVVLRISGPSEGTQVNYTFQETGYLSTDDWDEYIEKDALLQEIKKNTEADNKIKKPGYPKLYIDGWLQEPLLDKMGSMVYWAISLHTDKGDKFVNAKVLKLARKGYTSILWMGRPELFGNAENSLTPALKAYQFNEGLTYADYNPIIDNVAPFGIGALTYKLITGKTGSKASAVAGAGLLAMLSVFAKKAWFLIFIPLAFAWKWLKNLFIGSKDGA